MVAYNVISADPHIVEPPDMYTNYIEPKYRDRAPSIERRRTRWGQAYNAWCYEGNRVGTVMHDLGDFRKSFYRLVCLLASPLRCRCGDITVLCALRSALIRSQHPARYWVNSLPESALQ
jgi:hypothetical protein